MEDHPLRHLMTSNNREITLKTGEDPRNIDAIGASTWSEFMEPGLTASMRSRWSTAADTWESTLRSSSGSGGGYEAWYALHDPDTFNVANSLQGAHGGCRESSMAGGHILWQGHPDTMHATTAPWGSAYSTTWQLPLNTAARTMESQDSLSLI